MEKLYDFLYQIFSEFIFIGDFWVYLHSHIAAVCDSITVPLLGYTLQWIPMVLSIVALYFIVVFSITLAYHLTVGIIQLIKIKFDKKENLVANKAVSLFYMKEIIYNLYYSGLPKFVHPLLARKVYKEHKSYMKANNYKEPKSAYFEESPDVSEKDKWGFLRFSTEDYKALAPSRFKHNYRKLYETTPIANPENLKIIEFDDGECWDLPKMYNHNTHMIDFSKAEFKVEE